MLDEKTIAEMVKFYIDYLDKEMTIQGVLSVFCVDAAGLFGEKILGAPEKTTVLGELQALSYWYVVATIIALILAAFLFYAQRSWLALLLGQISLAVSRLADNRQKNPDEFSAFQWMDDADSWRTWDRYLAGLACLTLAGFECLLALIAVQEPWVRGHRLIGTVTPVVGVALVLVYILRGRVVLESKRRTRGSKKSLSYGW
jgi:hypothetical protein